MHTDTPVRTVPRGPRLEASAVAHLLVAWALAAGAVVVVPGAAGAFDPQGHVPFAPGSTGGVPIGVLPLPGFYLSSLGTWTEGSYHADTLPRKVPGLYVVGESLTFLWVPDVKILGASYGAFINQGFVQKTITHIPPRNIGKSETGPINTMVSPLNLAWSLPSNLYVSGRFAFYPPDGQYDRDNLVNIANHFWTFEPNVGISYLNGGLDLSLHLVYDIPTENESTNVRGSVNHRYQSGNVFTADYSASYAIGHWRFGLTGWGVQQTNDDSAGGRTLRGTQLWKVGLGPLIEYNISWLGVNLYYIRDVAWNNAFGGNTVYLRATFKF